MADGRIVIDDQRILADQMPELGRDNDPISIALRPEAITLTRGESNETTSINANGETNVNRLVGTVEDLYFLGSVVRTRVRLQTQMVNVDIFNNPNASLPTRGETVTLHFPREACHILN